MNIEFKEMIASMNAKIADANAKLTRLNGRGGFFLIARDGILVIDKVGEQFRFVGSAADKGHKFATFGEAARAASMWNAALTNEQREANCVVMVADFRTYMARAMDGWLQLLSVLKVAA
jgi:hypothetical protein